MVVGGGGEGGVSFRNSCDEIPEELKDGARVMKWTPPQSLRADSVGNSGCGCFCFLKR